MPLDGEAVFFGTGRTAQALVLQNNQRHVATPFQMFAGIELAGGSQEVSSIESAVLRRIAFRIRRGNRNVETILLLVRRIHQNHSGS